MGADFLLEIMFSVINGDLVTGESKLICTFFCPIQLTQTCLDTFRENVTNVLDQIVMPFNYAKTPFAVTLGVSVLCL